MKVNFFQLKWLISDCFYTEILRHDVTMGQAAGITYEAFSEYVNSDSIDSIIAIATIIRLQMSYKFNPTEYDVEYIKKMLALTKTFDIKKLLNHSELEYLEEDIECIEYEYNQIIK